MSLPSIGDRVLYFPGTGEEGEGQGPFPAVVEHVLPSGQLHLLVNVQIDDQDAKDVEKTCVQFLDVGPMNRVGAYCCSMETAKGSEIVAELDSPPPTSEPLEPPPGEDAGDEPPRLPTNPPSDPPPLPTVLDSDDESEDDSPSDDEPPPTQE